MHGVLSFLAPVRIFPAPPKPAKPRKLEKGYRRRLIAGTVLILRRGDPPSPFFREGFCVAGIRSGLCLRGWPWPEADEASRTIVREALRTLGARRPTWAMARGEWEEEMIGRTRCMTCGSKLPEGHWKFCDRVCTFRYHNGFARLRYSDEADA